MRVRVVVVNWNSFQFTHDCLSSIEAAGFSGGELEIVVVDNASVDGSLERLRHRHPRIRYIVNHQNLGFAEACNQGMRDREGVDAVALVNNDATVEPGWLEPLAAALRRDPTVGAVAALLVLDPPFFSVPIGVDRRRSLRTVELFEQDGDGVTETVTDVTRRCIVDGGETIGDPRWPLDTTHVIDGTCTIMVPASQRARTVRVTLGDEPLVPGRGRRDRAPVAADEADRMVIEVPVGDARTELANGLGTRRTPWGEAYDIGFGLPVPDVSSVAAGTVDGFCGGGVLLRSAALDDVGLFDPRFFAYYEDSDLSWRMTRAGWRIATEPSSRIHHHFGGSGGAHAPWFFFLNYRNWMLMTLRNGDRAERRRALRQLREWLSTAVRSNIGSPLRHGRPPSLRLLVAWSRVLLGVATAMPRIWVARGSKIGLLPTVRVRSRLQSR